MMGERFHMLPAFFLDHPDEVFQLRYGRPDGDNVEMVFHRGFVDLADVGRPAGDVAKDVFIVSRKGYETKPGGYETKPLLLISGGLRFYNLIIRVDADW